MSNAAKHINDRLDAQFIIVAHTLFAGAALMAVYFYLERNMGDPGWRIFCMINRELPCPSHGRWILLLNQVLPVLAIKAGASLKSILVLHAVSSVLVYYIFFLYCAFRLRDRWASIAILVSNVFTVGIIYFNWPDLEKHLMVPMLITVFALLFTDRKVRPDRIIMLPILFYLIIGSHPTVILPVGFILVWYTITKKKLPAYSLFLVIVLAILMFKQMDTYEQKMFSGLSLLGGDEMADIEMPISRLGMLLANNILMWLMLAATSVTLFMDRKFLPVAFLLAFSIAYLVMILAFVSQAQQEPYLIPLMSVVLLTFMYTAGLKMFSGTRGTALTALLFLIGIINIISQSKAAVQKTKLINDLAVSSINLNGGKFLADDEYIGTDELKTNKDFFFAETMVVSAMHGPQHAKAIVPARVFRESLINISAYIDHEVLTNIFPHGLENVPDSILLQYADSYYDESYSQAEFKMWFDGRMNQTYFDPDSSDFQWLQHASEKDFGNPGIDNTESSIIN